MMAKTIVPSNPNSSLGTMHFFTTSGIQVHSNISVEKKVWNNTPMMVVAIPKVMPSGAILPSFFFNARLPKMRTRP